MQLSFLKKSQLVRSGSPNVSQTSQICSKVPHLNGKLIRFPTHGKTCWALNFFPVIEDGSERFSDQRRWKYERSDHIAVAGRLEGKATQTFYLGIIQTAFELSKGQTGLEVG